MVWLSGRGTFAEAAEILERVGQVSTGAMSVWRQAQQTGQQFAAVEAQWRGQATEMPKPEEIVPGERRVGRRMGVAMDGTMIYIRDEDGKELKVGCVFEVETERRYNPDTGESESVGSAVHSSYTAHLGGPEVFGQQVWAEADRRHFTQATETLAIGDGAPWIWNLVREHFFDSRHLVDWYHAQQHLAIGARLLYDQDLPTMTRWLHTWETALYQGHADRLAQHLRQRAQGCSPDQADQLLREAGYFRDNHKRMNYQEMRDKLWPIGSGMVESGGRQFKARFCGSGMRWSRAGAEHLIPIRSAILSRRFDDYWQAASRLPLN